MRVRSARGGVDGDGGRSGRRRGEGRGGGPDGGGGERARKQLHATQTDAMLTPAPSPGRHCYTRRPLPLPLPAHPSYSIPSLPQAVYPARPSSETNIPLMIHSSLHIHSSPKKVHTGVPHVPSTITRNAARTPPSPPLRPAHRGGSYPRTRSASRGHDRAQLHPLTVCRICNPPRLRQRTCLRNSLQQLDVSNSSLIVQDNY
ncbi:hypothetical protein FKP32DRAFT_683578 [Trametes sanguinea]|nr:hypothetical protein FKP32DRAFT_683578 [Trametes sanguinea]